MKNFVKILIFAGLLLVFLYPVSVVSEELSFVTVNVWPGIDYKGFFSCNEYETENDRLFRQEVLFSGLEALGADIIVLNGINPAENFSAAAAEHLGMNRNVGISRSGFRIGPVSLPMNLKAGDAILTAEAFDAVEAGRLHMNGGFSKSAVTLFSRNGVQVIGSRIAKDDISFYIFSVVWSESLFNDAISLKNMTDGYLNGSISPDEYMRMMDDAVSGSQMRLSQAAETLSFINSIAGESSVILMGSLNALPDSDELAVLKNAGFIDVFQKSGRGSGYTIDIEGNSNHKKIPEDSLGASDSGQYRADYIMIRGAGLKPVSAEVVLDSPVYGVYPSLRYGVRAVIELPSNPSE